MRFAAVVVTIIALGSAPGGVHADRAEAAGRASSDAVLASRYSDLVWRFHAATGADPVRDLEHWDPADIRRALGVVAGVLRSRSAPLDPLLQFAAPDTRRRAGEAARREGAEAAQAMLIRSAAVLQLDTAAALWRDGNPANAAVHVSLIDADLEPLLSPRDSETALLVCRAGGAVLTGAVQFSAALHHYDACLDRHAGDAWLLLGRGSTYESAARAIAGQPAGSRIDGWTGPSTVDQMKRAAAADFESAIAHASDLAEARIRLAAIELGLDHVADAGRELSRVDRPQPYPILEYWRLLFEGAIAERGGAAGEAADRYRRALALYPTAQTAGLALAHVMAESLDQRDRATAILRQQIAPSGNRRFDSDPYWLYPGGQAWRLPQWLRELGQRIRRP